MLFVCTKGVQGDVGALQVPFVEQSLDRPVSTEGRKRSENLTQVITAAVTPPAGCHQTSAAQMGLYQFSKHHIGGSWIIFRFCYLQGLLGK